MRVSLRVEVRARVGVRERVEQAGLRAVDDDEAAVLGEGAARTTGEAQVRVRVRG